MRIKLLTGGIPRSFLKFHAPFQRNVGEPLHIGFVGPFARYGFKTRVGPFKFNGAGIKGAGSVR